MKIYYKKNLCRCAIYAILSIITMTLSACNQQPNRVAETIASTELLGLSKGIAIRGGQCSTKNFIKGASSESNGYITGLSVNCTNATNDKANFGIYLAGLPVYAQYCVAKLSQLEKNNVKITLDPITGNRYHCLLSGKAKSIAKVLTRYP